MRSVMIGVFLLMFSAVAGDTKDYVCTTTAGEEALLATATDAGVIVDAPTFVSQVVRQGLQSLTDKEQQRFLSGVRDLGDEAKQCLAQGKTYVLATPQAKGRKAVTGMCN